MHGTSINLKFEDGPASWPGIYDPPSLDYVTEARNFGQPRYHGRVCIAPRIDLNAYSCKAVIDWLEIGMRTNDCHQSVNVQKAAARALRDAGSTSSVYVTGPTPRRRKNTMVHTSH